MATVEQQPAALSSDGHSGRTIAVENPATGERIGSVPVMSPEQVREIVARGRAVQPAWRGIGYDGRARILRRAQMWVLDNVDRIIDTIVSETGKTYEDAALAEVYYAAVGFGFWAKAAPKYLADEKVKSASIVARRRRLIVRYEPLGVIGVIGPWNYPLTNSFGDCIPALAAGNSVVLKPSEVTPMTSLLMGEALAECGLPEHVYQVATGDGETGAALIDDVDMIMFTGSTATGKKVMERAARTLTPVSLELGGKDPVIVLADADLERAANTVTWASMQNSGQTCLSVERVYVEEPIYDEFVGMVAERVRELRQGVPGKAGQIDVGSITFPPQLDIIESHVNDAVSKGARVLTGGHAKRERGIYYEPTVLADVDHTMECMREETFGPTVPIMKVADAEEAIRLANDSPYGLGAAVFTGDLKRGEAIARRIQAGVCSVNDALNHYAAIELPMGGWKASGLGSRHGAGGIRKYCRQQALVVSRMPFKKEVYMFPYKASKTRFLRRLMRIIYYRRQVR